MATMHADAVRHDSVERTLMCNSVFSKEQGSSCVSCMKNAEVNLKVPHLIEGLLHLWVATDPAGSANDLELNTYNHMKHRIFGSP